MRNILIVPISGLGNSIMCARVYKDIAIKLKKTDIYLQQESIAEEFWGQVTKEYKGKVLVDCPDKLKDYNVLAIGRIGEPRIKADVRSVRTRTCSEVKDNELLLEKLGITPTYEHFQWRFNEQPDYDVVICNGSVNKYSFLKKRYRRWNEVISKLPKGLSIASIGLPEDYIFGTDDMTDLSLIETMDLISNCKVFASNDTGLYHFACFIGVLTVVAVTASNLSKIYDKDFHRIASMITPTLDCAPCHGMDSNVWIRQPHWYKCKNWKCCEYDPDIIVNEIKERLNEY